MDMIKIICGSENGTYELNIKFMIIHFNLCN